LEDDRPASHISQLKSQVDDDINLLDLWRVLVKRKKLIGLIVGGAFVGSITVSLLLPKMYASTASVLPPQQESSLSAGLTASQLSVNSLGGMAGGFLGLKSPSDLWVGILKSETVRDAIITRFDLKTLYRDKTIEDTRSDLDKNVWIRKSKEDIISVTVEDKDPKRSAEMANAFVEELDKVNKRVVMTSGGRMRAFVEKRLAESKEDLAKVEEQVRVFQDKNRAVKLDDQSKAMIEAMGKVKGQLMAREVELQTLLSYATPNNPQAEILQSQVEELRTTLRDLEEGRKGEPAASKTIFIPPARIPDLVLQYERLLRDAKVQETLYGLLTQQYEMARIQEAKDSPTVQILDVAKVPQRKSRPKRLLIVLMSSSTATFFGAFLAFCVEFVEKVKKNPVRIKIDLIDNPKPTSKTKDKIQEASIKEESDR
jgi:tyrosine-protein kinase Etk/Wzc